MLTPATAPAEKKLTAMLPLTVPAAAVLTPTVRPPPEAPASRPLTDPEPVMRLEPVPDDAPKEAFRSSTKPDAPVAVLRTVNAWVTTCPTWTVPKLSGAVVMVPAAAW